MALIGDLRKTVYLTTPGTFVGVDHEALEIRRPDMPAVRAPISGVDALVCFGNVQLSTEAIRRCVDNGVSVSWLRRNGRFAAGLRGPASGNVLLRLAQFSVAVAPERALAIAAPMVAAKILNSRTLLLDAAKDRVELTADLRALAAELADCSAMTKRASSLDELRGIEGFSAKRYFAGLALILSNSPHSFQARVRRPPTDPVNAMLSFLYGLLRIRCEGAAESAGLDPQVGFLHSVRPGRASLALDLMEELRAPLADRLVLTLVNRRQVHGQSFESLPGGAVSLTDAGRNAVLTAWDAHLGGTVPHRTLEQPIERRQIPFLQATLLARHLRGDLGNYLPHRSAGR